MDKQTALKDRASTVGANQALLSLSNIYSEVEEHIGQLEFIALVLGKMAFRHANNIKLLFPEDAEQGVAEFKTYINTFIDAGAAHKETQQ